MVTYCGTNMILFLVKSKYKFLTNGLKLLPILITLEVLILAPVS